MHDRRRLEAHLAQLRREVVRAAVAEGALLPEEAVDAARQPLHVLHPGQGLRLVALETERHPARLRGLAVAAVLAGLEHALEREGRGVGAAMGEEALRVARQRIDRLHDAAARGRCQAGK
jgi:hypothetical protein